MPIFTAAAAAIVSTTALTGLAATIATNIIAVGLLVGTNQLLGLDEVDGPAAPVDEGVDVRLGANTQNRLPILYGDFQSRGIVCFYTLSESKQSLTTVLALGEGPITSIDEVLWEDYTLTLDANGVVTNATRLVGTETETTDKYNGKITVQLYPMGGRSTYLEGITSDWTSAHAMSDIAYVIVSIDYDREAGIVGLSDMRFRGTGAVDNPATAVRNLLQNSVYGVGLPDASIDIDSFDTAVAYFNEQVSFDNDSETQKRSRLNGVLNASDTVSRRIGIILEGCNSSLRWYNGQWGLFIDKEDNATSFTFDTDNIIGSINVVETGLTNLYNRMVIEYGRGVENNYQRATVELLTPDAVRYPNEIDRTINLSLPLVNNSTEATAIGTVILNKGRQQLSVSHRADVTAMPLEPGDVVRYNDEDYGWSNKLFRVISVAEIYENGALSYEIQSVEYADAVYDYGVLNAHDVSPNAATVSVETIEPVDDLVITGNVRTAATPYISLQWTSPPASLVEQFFIFYNLQNKNFNSRNTKLGGVEQLPAGNYVVGETVTHQLVGVPAGDVSIWVVASNDFVTSTESNRVEVLGWRPTVVQDGVFEIVTRYNETPSVIAGVDIDVGAPPANATGTGTGRNNNSNDTGWYIFDPEATDRENAPVWTATTETQRSDTEARVLDFAFSGTSATQTTTFTPETQETDFTFSGTVGERQFFYNARPEKTNFTLSGQASDFDPGIGAQWGITVTGDTESTGPDTNDVFYIAPMGTSDTFTGESFTFTPSGNTADGDEVSNVTSGLSYSAGGQVQLETFILVVNSSGTSDGQTFNNVTEFTNQTSINVFVDLTEAELLSSFIGIPFSSSFSLPPNTNISWIMTDGTNTVSADSLIATRILGPTNGRYTLTLSIRRNSGIPLETTGLVNGTFNFGSTGWELTLTDPAISSSVTITLDTETNSYTLTDNLSGGAAIGADLNTAIGTDFSDFSKTFDATTGAVTFTALDSDDHTSSVAVVSGTNGALTIAPSGADAVGTVSTIQLEITTESIDETISIASNLTGAALRTNVFNLFNAITSITDEFTLALTTIEIDGTDTEVVRFTANDFTDHIFAVSINSGLIGTTSGTINEGQDAGTATTIRITYDDSITPSFQDITFGPGDTDNAIDELVTLIDGHGNLSADTGTIVTGSSGSPQFRNSSAVNGLVDFDSVPSNGSLNRVDTSEFNITFDNSSSVLDIDPVTAASDDIIALDVPTQTIVVEEIMTSVNTSGFLVVNLDGVRSSSNQKVSQEFAIVYKVTSVSGTSIGVERISSFYNGFSDSNERFLVSTGGVTNYSRTIHFYNDISEAYATNSLETESGIIITSGLDGVLDVPVVTVTTQGTGDVAFDEYIVKEGLDPVGTATSYSITYAGQAVAGGNFSPGSSSTSMATQLVTAMDSTSVITGTSVTNVVTSTSVANSAFNTSVTLTQGTNKPGGTSTNNASLVRAVTQVGSTIDAFGGVDASVSALIGGEIYYFNAYDGDTLEDIVADIVAGINTNNPSFSNFFTAGVQADDNDEIKATSDFTGTTPILTMAVIPGFVATSDAIGNISQVAATLAVDRIVISDGQSDPVIDGVLSTYSVTQGSTEVIAATDLPTGTPFGTVATLIATAISAIPDTIDYTTTVDGGTLEATSTFNDTEPDLTITLVGGTNADSTLPDLQVVKTVIQTGDVGVIDLTTAQWTYAVTAPTTDDDLLMLDENGVLTARRGLVLDTTELQYTSPDFNTFTIISTTQHTVGSRPASLIFTGLVSMPAISTSIADGTNSVGYTIDYSTDYDPDDPDSATFTALDSLSFFTAFPAIYAGQLVPVPLGVSATLNSDPDLTYTFRLTRIGDMTIGGFSWNMLILEELRA